MITMPKKTDIKLINKTNILQLVRNYGETTQPEIAKELGLSKPTVSALVEELIADRYIKVNGVGTSTDQGGKRPRIIAFNAEGGGIISLYVGVRRIEAALVDLSANILCSVKVGMKETDSIEKIMDCVFEAVEKLFYKAQQISVPVLGIGVGCPGLVETRTGMIVHSSNFPVFNRVRIGEMLAERFGRQVWVDNSSRNLVMAEKLFGLGRDVSTFVSLETQVGIGAGVIINNQIMRGLDDSFGEVGHTTIQIDGPVCTCGNRGCWETYASSRALLRTLSERLEETAVLKELLPPEEELSMAYIVEAIQKGDVLVQKIAIEDLGKYLGVGIANIVNMLNPELLVVQGEFACLGEALLERIRAEVKARALPTPASRVRIAFSELGEDANIMGAGALVLKELFDHPLYLFSS